MADTTYVLECMSEIDNVVFESYIDTCKAMTESLDKLITLEAYCSPDDSEEDIIQEGRIWDEATGKGKFENVVIRMIKFVPRLLMSVAKALHAMIKGEKYDYQEYLRGEKRIQDASDEELQKLAKTVSEATDGKIQFDPNTKKYNIFGPVGLFNKVMMATEIAVLLKNIKSKLNSDTPEYKAISDEIGKIIRKEKTFDKTTAQASLSAIGKLAQDTTVPADLCANLCFEISRILDNKILKDIENGKDPSQLVEVRNALNGVKHVARTTAATSFFLGAAKKCKDFVNKTLGGKSTAEVVTDKMASTTPRADKPEVTTDDGKV